MLSCESLLDHRVPEGSVCLWWLGQTGFLIKSPQGAVVVLDPYLTDSCEAIGLRSGYHMARLAPPPIAPAALKDVDAYVMTHSHPDHLDPETLAAYRAAGGHGPYFAPAQTGEKLQELGVRDPVPL